MDSSFWPGVSVRVFKTTRTRLRREKREKERERERERRTDERPFSRRKSVQEFVVIK